MYLYFNRVGVLKEIINDKTLRQSDTHDKIYIYVEDLDLATISSLTFQYRNSSELLPLVANGYQVTNLIKIPYNPKQDLKYFNYFDSYKFIEIPTVFTYQDEQYSALAVPGNISLTVRINGDDLGLIVFNVEEAVDGNHIQPDQYLTLAQFYYLLNNMMSLNTEQIITGNKTFNGTVKFGGNIDGNMIPSNNNQNIGSLSSWWLYAYIRLILLGSGGMLSASETELLFNNQPMASKNYTNDLLKPTLVGTATSAANANAGIEEGSYKGFVFELPYTNDTSELNGLYLFTFGNCNIMFTLYNLDVSGDPIKYKVAAALYNNTTGAYEVKVLTYAYNDANQWLCLYSKQNIIPVDWTGYLFRIKLF